MLVEPNDRVFMSNFIFCRISSRSVRAAARTTHCLTPVLNGSVILMVCVPRCVYPSVCWRRGGWFLHSGCPAAVNICAQVFDWTAVSPSSGWGGNLWVRWPSFHLFRRPPHGLHCSCRVCLSRQLCSWVPVLPRPCPASWLPGRFHHSSLSGMK